MQLKRCTGCGQSYPLTEFRPRRARCLACHAAYRKQYRETHREHARAYRAAHPSKSNRSSYSLEVYRKWAAANQEKIRAAHKKHAVKRAARVRFERYGVTAEQYETMAAAQDHRCAVCEQSRPLCVDHGHVTGLVRRLLCRQCNWAVGWAEKHGRNAVTALAQYLEWIHIERRT